MTWSPGPDRRILLVEPDESFGQLLQTALGESYSLRQVRTVSGGIHLLGDASFEALLLNLDFPATVAGGSGPFDLLQAAAHMRGAPPVIAYGADSDPETAMRSYELGAVEFLEQPLNVHDLKKALMVAQRQAAIARELVAAQNSHGLGSDGLLGSSPGIREVQELARKVAGVSTTVLITGESGTGKGVVARNVHRWSERSGKPFVAFAGCSFPDTLVEDELFGHEKGAFTGATGMRRGRFEEADGGTIFLDEIGDLDLHLQAKLLRVLQERTVERLGSGLSRPVDVRVICATNCDLEKMVADGTFRKDLYFRISVVKMHMPALRERAEDIPMLAEYFLRTFSETHRKKLRGMTPGFLSMLAKHPWPGNVRELQNVMERCVVLAGDSGYLTVCDLPAEFRGFDSPDFANGAGSPFHASVHCLKVGLIRWALQLHGGNKLRAAKELGISRCYLHRLLSQLNIPDVPQPDERPLAAIERTVAMKPPARLLAV